VAFIVGRAGRARDGIGPAPTGVELLGLGLQLGLALSFIGTFGPRGAWVASAVGCDVTGVIDGCSGLSKELGSCAARSKLQDEYLVKKLSPHFHCTELTRPS
jgi:hypothetical protein